jgi:hypothetical protein
MLPAFVIRDIRELCQIRFVEDMTGFIELVPDKTKHYSPTVFCPRSKWREPENVLLHTSLDMAIRPDEVIP